MFADRIDAGRRLAERLKRYEDAPGAVVLGIPRGGVVVAAEVARVLRLPLGVVVSAKVGAPGNPEYAVGAIDADGVVLANPGAGITAHQASSIAHEAREKVTRRTAEYATIFQAPEVAGATAIVVDDGLATGLTALSAVGYLRRHEVARVVVAIPVASADAVAALEQVADEVIALDVPASFMAVGQFYARFDQTTDAEVERLLRDSAPEPQS